MLTRYSHDLRKATSHTMMVVDSELVVSNMDFFGGGIWVTNLWKVYCKRATSHDDKNASKTRNRGTWTNVCEMLRKSKHKSDCNNIESRFRPKAWLPNYLLLSFLLNGEYFKDYEHVLGILGVSHLSKSQWICVMKWVHLHVKDLGNGLAMKLREKVLGEVTKNT